MKSNLRTITLAVLLSIFFIPTIVEAHSPDQSYLYLRIYKEAIGGRFELTAKDMNKAGRVEHINATTNHVLTDGGLFVGLEFIHGTSIVIWFSLYL